MNIEVRYLSKSGNTKKIAYAIAQAVGALEKPITQSVPENTDILFLGGAVYYGGVDGELKQYIKTLKGKTNKVAVFSTSAMKASAYPQMKKLLQEQGIEVLNQEFHCWGKFLKVHGSRPNTEDLRLAEKFACEVIEGESVKSNIDKVKNIIV
jgi:menaquinone-dependent protoporphyrinogen IX oxidase